MKFIHFSDFHLGIEKGPIDRQSRIPERVLDYMDVLDSMIEFASDEEIDLAIFTGDAFHMANPDQTYLNLFAKSIEKLARLCKVILVTGNHDMPGPTHKSSSLDIFGSLKAENIIIGNKPKVHLIETDAGIVQVAVMPYPMKQWMMDIVDTPANKFNIDKEIKNILSDLGKDIDTQLPSILAAHLTVSTAHFASGQSLLIGASEGIVDIESLIWPWDYVALGHIHIHQVLCDDPPIIYAGSLERVDFGDERTAKGFVLGNIEDGKIDWEFIETDAREYITISVDLSGVDHGYTRKVLQEISKYDVKDAVVRVLILLDDAAHMVDSSEIGNVLARAEVFYVHEIRIKQKAIISTPRLDLDEPIASYSKIDLLDIYFSEQEMDDDKIDELLDMSEDIMKSVDMNRKL